MQAAIKKSLLRFGGYAGAKRLYSRFEQYQLARRIHRFLETGKLPLPDMVMFELTQRCNLRCVMCFQDRDILANKRREEISYDQIVEFFDSQPSIKKVTLIGGEIFVRKDMLRIIRYLDQSHNLVLATNATLLDEAKIKVLKSCRNIISICISLDGPREIHDAVRRMPGSFDKTVRAISALTRIFPVTVSCIISNENLHVLPELVDLCSTLGVRKLKYEFERIYQEEGKVIAMNETGLTSGDLPISSEGRRREYSLEKLRETLQNCLIRGKETGIHLVFDPWFLLDDLEACYSGNLRAKSRYVCQSFRTATLGPTGDVLNCFAIRRPFGNILERPFEEIWNSKVATEYRNQLVKNNLTPLCENCPFISCY